MADTKRKNKLPRLKKYVQKKTNFEKKCGRGYTKAPLDRAKRKQRKQLSKKLAQLRRRATRNGK